MHRRRVLCRIFGASGMCNILRHRAELRISLPSFLGISRLRNETAIFLTRLEAHLSLAALSWPARVASATRDRNFPSGIRNRMHQQKAIPQPRIWLCRYARTTNTATICQMFNCSNVCQYICTMTSAAFVCTYKFTDRLCDIYILCLLCQLTISNSIIFCTDFQYRVFMKLKLKSRHAIWIAINYGLLKMKENYVFINIHNYRI